MSARGDSAYARYCALRDRQAAGAVLTDAEVAFCEQMEREHPACKREEAWLSELADMDGAPSEAARSLVAATMDAVAEGALEGEVRPPSPPQHAERGKLMVVGAVLMVAAAFGLTWLSPPSQAPQQHAEHDGKSEPIPAAEAARRVELVYSSGTIHVDGRTPDEQGPATLLAAGQRLSVGDGGLCLVMDPGINICLDAHSELVLAHTTGTQQRLELVRGRVALALDPQPRGFDVTVVANGVESTAVGTVFSVALDEHAVRTTVLEGKVRVGTEGARAMVRAHERHVVADAARATEPLSRSEEAPEWAMVDATRLWRGRLSGTLLVSGEPAGAEVWLDGRQIGVTPLSSLIPAGEHRIRVRSEDGVLAERSIRLRAGQREAVAYTAPEPKPPARARMRRRPRPIADAVPNTEALLAEARRLMLEGRFQQAALTYRALRAAHGGSPEARTVLVPLAEIELDRLDSPKRALSLVDEYLSKANGALRHEALYLRVRALRKLGRTERERQAIETLLEAHPASFHATHLQARLEDLSR